MAPSVLYDAPWSTAALAGWVLAGVVAVLVAAGAVRAELRHRSGRAAVVADDVVAGLTIAAVVALLVALGLVVRAGLG